MKTIISIWGDGNKRTDEAAEILKAADIPFRVYLTHNYPGTVILSLPFGEIYGLDRIRAFADRWQKDRRTCSTKETKMTEEKNLYQVQDADRPMYVIASSWQDASDRWEAKIRIENDIESDEDVDPPHGIMLVAKADELLL